MKYSTDLLRVEYTARGGQSTRSIISLSLSLSLRSDFEEMASGGGTDPLCSAKGCKVYYMMLLLLCVRGRSEASNLSAMIRTPGIDDEVSKRFEVQPALTAGEPKPFWIRSLLPYYILYVYSSDLDPLSLAEPLSLFEWLVPCCRF